MKFTSATIDLENNVITMFEQFGEVVHFDMNEYRNGLPKYAGEQFEKNEIYKPDWKHIVL